jgi:hypothetical protein
MRIRHPAAFALRCGKSAVTVLFPLTSMISLISLLPEDDVWLIVSAIFEAKPPQKFACLSRAASR